MCIRDRIMSDPPLQRIPFFIRLTLDEVQQPLPSPVCTIPSPFESHTEAWLYSYLDVEQRLLTGATQFASLLLSGEMPRDLEHPMHETRLVAVLQFVLMTASAQVSLLCMFRRLRRCCLPQQPHFISSFYWPSCTRCILLFDFGVECRWCRHS